MRLLILALVLHTAAASAAAAALNDDVLGLIVFKSDLHDPHSSLASWTEDADDPCAFAGVTCDRRTRRATALSLPSLSLSGRLGRGLLRLSALRSLSLPNNSLSGPLPAFLSSIPSLDLSSNRLSGPIPHTFFSSSARAILLSNNALTGSIPASISNCIALTQLNLSSNALSGIIPNSLWAVSTIRSLDLSHNSLTGDIAGEISAMYNLRVVKLNGNQLSGAIPDSIGRCLLLRVVDFSANSLSGGLPGSMRRLSLCGTMNLSANSFSGVVPMWVGEMVGLVVLDLSSNGFSGPVPDALGKLGLLKEVNLSGNALTGGLPEAMGNCKSLEAVDFSRNSLSGGLPLWVWALRRVLISGNKMSGEIMVPKDGEVLDLSGNVFSGEIPWEMGEARRLVVLDLSENLLSGEIPVSLGELKLVEVLDLSQNQLNGSIPPEFGGCSSLTSLILSQNDFTGPIPSTLANLTRLQSVDLSLNRLTGALPKQLANLPDLLTFNISDNLLSGDLPGGSFFNTINPSSVSGNPGLCGAAANRSCPGVLPKPIVLNPETSTATGPSAAAFPNRAVRHRKIILSISVLIAIGAAALMAIGVVTITILNARARHIAATTATTSQFVAAPALYTDYSSRSPNSGPNSGKIIMLSGKEAEFNASTQPGQPLLKKDCELGRGGFGTVYKTILQDGRPVAIKRLTTSGLVKSQEDFVRAVKKLGRLRHPNLVELQGYYWTQSMQMLVYEYIPCGSLHKHLHEPSSEALSWGERFDIVLGVARSLAHLHRHNVIHYNLKSSNVLIDGAGEAKIGDYGLDKLLPLPNRYILSSKIQSALGYTAPEFACSSVRITEKCDVYGFGALVLEAVTGRRPVEYTEDDVVMLCDVVRSAVEGGRAEECVDGMLGGRFPSEEAVPMMKLGLACTLHMPSNRPEMEEVVNILEMMRAPIDSPEEELS